MVHIITGSCNSGKSTHFLRLWQEAGGTDKGLWSKKQKDTEGNIIGYDVVLLPSMYICPLARTHSTGSLSSEFNLSQGRFLFSSQAFGEAMEYVLSSPLASSVWIDEVGKLELRELGYAPLLRTLLAHETDITLTIRDSYVAAFLEIYKVRDYRMI